MSYRRANPAPTVPLSVVEATFGLSLAVARERHARLTPREAQVAARMATGRSNAEIAAELGISPKTLDIHRAAVQEKLEAPTTAGVANVVNLLRLAAEALPPPSQPEPSGNGPAVG
jgi:DNA-binding CsgD family transcriptional regulator